MKTTLLIQISAAITLTMGLNAQDFNEVFRTAASDGEMGENFGHSVSLSGWLLHLKPVFVYPFMIFRTDCTFWKSGKSNTCPFIESS